MLCKYLCDGTGSWLDGYVSSKIYRQYFIGELQQWGGNSSVVMATSGHTPW